MNVAELLGDGAERVHDVVHQVLDGIDARTLTERLDPRANTVAWLIWHLTRVQDNHVSDAAGQEQVWLRDGWVERFDLPLDRRDTGYGAGAEQVASVRASSELLIGYHDAVYKATRDWLRQLRPGDLDRVVDEQWDPPVTLGVRLVSVLSDDLQHAGQAALVRGVIERRSR